MCTRGIWSDAALPEEERKEETSSGGWRGRGKPRWSFVRSPSEPTRVLLFSHTDKVSRALDTFHVFRSFFFFFSASRSGKNEVFSVFFIICHYFFYIK